MRVRALALAALLLLPSALAVAPEPAVVGDLIVTLRERTPIPAHATALAVLPGYVLHDATEGDAARLSADPRVERVDWAVPLAFSSEARLPTRAFTSLTRADATGLDGSGITVAVLDSGIDAAHPDLAGRVRENVRLVEKRFVPAPGDPDGHGTHVAGVLAASGDASQGRWTGVAPGVDLVGIDISTRFTTASAVLAYDWLLTRHEELGVRIVVNAWGRIGEGERYDARDPVVRAIDRLVDEGVVVVFSASNHGPAAGTLSLEAMHPRVITVGATDAAGLLADYSSRGPVRSVSEDEDAFRRRVAVNAAAPWSKPDVVAPGDAVVGPRSAQSLPREGDPTPLHTTYSGTSQAAPHVAGIVAMMLQARPAMTPDDVAHALRASAIDLGEPGPDHATGYGLVDGQDALRIAAGRAPDRGNALIVGGHERYHDAMPIAARGERGLLGMLARPDVVWETPFPVKPGARDLRASALVEGAQGVEIELVHDGSLFRATQVEDPAPGVWLLRVRAAVPFATTARATIETELPPDPARALVFDGRQAAAVPGAPDAGVSVLAALCVAVAALASGAAGSVLWARRRGN